MGRPTCAEWLRNVMIKATQLVTQFKSPPLCDIKVLRKR